MADPIVPPSNPSSDSGSETPENSSTAAPPLRTRDTLINKIRRVLTSTAYLIIAFIFVQAFMQLMMGGIAHLLGYSIEVNYNKLIIPHKEMDYHHWSKGRVMAVNLLPPFFCLFMGFMLLNYLKVTAEKIKRWRMLIFWLMICFANICLAHIFISPIGMGTYYMPDLGYYQTFSVVASWMFLPTTVMGAFAALAVIFSIVFGVITRDEVLRFSHVTRSVYKPQGKHLAIFQLYLLPVILSSFPLFYLTDSPTPVLISFNLLIISIGMFVKNFNDNKGVRPDKNDVLNHFPLIELAIVIVLWVFIFFFYSFEKYPIHLNGTVLHHL